MSFVEASVPHPTETLNCLGYRMEERFKLHRSWWVQVLSLLYAYYVFGAVTFADYSMHVERIDAARNASVYFVASLLPAQLRKSPTW
jgi:purine-cytosine permease-like protein